jgi:hypothetical protein
MSRFIRWAPPVLVLLAIPGRPAAAQFNIIGPGSTPAGDMMRGEGVAASGWGLAAHGWGAGYHHSALGRAADADTRIRLAAAAARDEEADTLKRLARLARRKALVQIASETKLSRLLQSPDDSDITGGDSLNALARQLTGPPFGLSALRFAPAQVPAGMLERLPLHLARAGLAIAPDRLRVAGRWPAPLQSPAFAPARLAYDRAVATVFDQAARGHLTADSVAAVDRASVGLRRELEAAARVTPSSDWVPALSFVIRLDRAARALHDPAGAAAFTAVLGRGVTSVAGVIELMRRHHLQFGPAESPDEEERYRDLFARLLEQRSRLTGPDDGPRVGRTIPAPRPGPEVAALGAGIREEVERD